MIFFLISHQTWEETPVKLQSLTNVQICYVSTLYRFNLGEITRLRFV
jgi:hypothetical protein